MTESSEEIWWSKLDPDELTLTPSLIVDPSEKLDSKFDPSDYYHLKQDFGFGPQARFQPLTCPDCQHDCRDNDDKCCPECGRSKILIENLVNNVIENEMVQTGDSDIVEDLTYTLDRMMRGRRIRKQVGVDQGLAHGNEAFVISENVILPWIAEEFVNCLGFFLMTRKPKYWRNRQCEVRVVQPFSSELIEVLKEAD